MLSNALELLNTVGVAALILGAFYVLAVRVAQRAASFRCPDCHAHELKLEAHTELELELEDARAFVVVVKQALWAMMKHKSRGAICRAIRELLVHLGDPRAGRSVFVHGNHDSVHENDLEPDGAA